MLNKQTNKNLSVAVQVAYEVQMGTKKPGVAYINLLDPKLPG